MDAFDPTAPVERDRITLDPTTLNPLSLDPAEQTNNIRIAPGRRLLVIRARSVLVIDYSDEFNLAIEGSVVMPTLVDMSTCTTPGARTFEAMQSAEVFDINNHRLAFIETFMKHVGLPGPPARGLLVCDLDDYTTPLLVTSDDKFKYDPVPCVSVLPNGFYPADFCIHALDVVEVQPGIFKMFLAASRGYDAASYPLRRVDVSDVPTLGLVDDGGLDLNDEDGLSGADSILWLVADPQDPYLHVMGQNFVYTVAQDLSSSAFTWESFGNKGVKRDAEFLLEPPAAAPTKTIWSLARGPVGYRWKIQDVTSVDPPNEIGPVIAPDNRRYAQEGADGAVAKLDWNSVYITTWGGVVRYEVDLSTGFFEPDYDSFRPATSAPNDSAYSTEHIALGELPSGEFRLFTTDARGGFYQWGISSSPPHHPQDIGHVPGGKWPAGWEPAQNTFGNDVDFAVNPKNGHGVVLVDWAKKASDQKVAVNCYDLEDQYWHGAIVLSAPLVPNGRDVVVDGEWLFVGAVGGFAVVDLCNWVEVDTVPIDNFAGGFDEVKGIARYKDRLFVSMGKGSGQDQDVAIAVYDFDQITGQVVDTPMLYVAQTATENDFGGLALSGGGRCHVYELDPGSPTTITRVRVYSGTQNGHLLEMEYAKNFVYPNPIETFTPIAFWHSGGCFAHVQDNIVYDLGTPQQPNPRVLVGKFSEVFALVRPLGF